VTAVFFLISALVDLVIDLDIQRTGGIHAARIVAIANIPVLLALIVAAAAMRRTPSAKEREAPSTSAERKAIADPDEDSATLSALDRAMMERSLYRDPELTLERLARQIGIPSRRISGAINRSTGGNVSHYVNDYRVREAQRLLEASHRPITEILFECGFQTKSNFNREFRRVAGSTPSEYRSEARRRADNNEPSKA
jgi:AraC-like DNA-binding protein